MQETYQAVIVEDDPMIASIDQNFLERDPRFRLAASFRSGQDALPWLLRHPADLLILYAPDDRAGASAGAALFRNHQRRGDGHRRQ